MRVINCKDYDEVSRVAADIVGAQVVLKPDCVLGLPTGGTPIGMYDELSKRGLDFSKVKTFNLDEYYPIKRANDQSYHFFMNQELFSKINIDLQNTNVPNGEASDPLKECEDYEAKIAVAGGVDLQVLGIGQNGHIGFNEPGDSLVSKTHVIELTENTIEVNSRYFEKIEDVPKKALTMGMGTINCARKIIILACGAEKRAVVAGLLSGEIKTENPATFLHLHPDVTLIVDEAAIKY